MEDSLAIKKALFEACLLFVNNKLSTIEEVISSNQKALQTETKSSAGDKHETGRAMLQLEMEKAGQQLSVVAQMKDVLARIDISKPATVAHLGTIVKTTNNTYFLSISAGKITLENKDYFAVSTDSPIGKLLLGKQETAEVLWNNTSIKILEII